MLATTRTRGGPSTHSGRCVRLELADGGGGGGGAGGPWGSEPHPALRATFRSLPFKVGISTTFPGGLPCASSPHGAGTQVKAALLGTWTSPALLREAPRKFKALAALPPSPFPSEPQHLPSHPPSPHPHPQFISPRALSPVPLQCFLCNVPTFTPSVLSSQGTPCHRCWVVKAATQRLLGPVFGLCRPKQDFIIPALRGTSHRFSAQAAWELSRLSLKVMPTLKTDLNGLGARWYI